MNTRCQYRCAALLRQLAIGLLPLLSFFWAPSTLGATQTTELTVSAPETEEKEIELAVRDGLSDFDLHVSLTDFRVMDLERLLAAKELPEILARIWVRSTDEFLDIYVADNGRGRVFIRRLRGQGRPSAVRYEELTQVIRAVVQAMLEGGVIGVTFEQAKLSEKPRVPLVQSLSAAPQHAVNPSSKEITPKVTPHLLYEVFAFAKEMPIRQRFGFDALLALEGGGYEWGLSGGVLYSLAKYRNEVLMARLDTLYGRIVLDMRPPFAGSWRWRLGFGGGTEVVFLNPQQTSDTLMPTKSRVLCFGALRGEVGLEWRISRLIFGVSLFADVALSNVNYVADGGSGSESQLDPWAINPGLGLQLGFH